MMQIAEKQSRRILDGLQIQTRFPILIQLNQSTHLLNKQMFYCNNEQMFRAWLFLNMINPQIQESNFNVTSPSIPSPQNNQGFRIYQEFQADQHHQAKSRKSSADQTADINKDQLSLKKISNEEIDDDYRPAKSNKRKARKNKQDENRNVIPNSIHQILSFIQKKTKSLSYVQKAFAKFEHQEAFTIARFYLYQLRIKQNINHYVNQNTLSLLNQLHDITCQVFSQAEQLFYLKVCRVIVHQFLNEESASIILTSKRMSQDKKKNHLNVRRFLKEKLYQVCRN